MYYIHTRNLDCILTLSYYLLNPCSSNTTLATVTKREIMASYRSHGSSWLQHLAMVSPLVTGLERGIAKSKLQKYGQLALSNVLHIYCIQDIYSNLSDLKQVLPKPLRSHFSINHSKRTLDSKLRIT